MKEERLEIEFSLMAESFDESFKKEFPNYTNGLIRGEPGGIVLTPTYSEYDGAQELYNFHVRNDDIWILSFPKSGESIIIVVHFPCCRTPHCLSNKNKRSIGFFSRYRYRFFPSRLFVLRHQARRGRKRWFGFLQTIVILKGPKRL